MKKARVSIITIVTHHSGVIQSERKFALLALIVGLCLLSAHALLLRSAWATSSAHEHAPAPAEHTAPAHDAQSMGHAAVTRPISTTRIDIIDVDDSTIPMTNIIIINVPPRPEDASLTTSEDTAVSGQLVATDGNDNEVLTYRIIESPANGTAVITNITGGNFVYTPTRNFYGTDRFTFRVNDGQIDSRFDGTVTIMVSAVNDAPNFVSSDLLTATAKRAYTATVNARDVDDDALSITALALPSWLSLDDNSNGSATLSGTPGTADVGTHNVVLRVADDNGADATRQFPLVVLPPDEASLQVDMLSSASKVVSNHVVTYTVVVTNSGPAMARAVALTVTLTDGSEFVAAAVLDSERVYPADGTWQCALVGSSQFTTCTRPTLEIGTSFAITLAARVKMGPGEAAATAQVTAANYPADIAAASDSITLDVLGSTYIPMLFTPLRQLPASEARNSTHIDQDREYPDAPMSWFVPGVRVWLADRASWQ